MNSPDAVLVKSRLKSWLNAPTCLSWIALVLLFSWPDFYVKAAMMMVGPTLSGIGLYLCYRQYRWSPRMMSALLSLAVWLLLWGAVLFRAFLERPQWG